MELGRDGGLVVIAPRHWTEAQIRTTLADNVSRVDRFVSNARQRQQPALRYESGERHLYLGEAYPLAAAVINGRKSQVHFDGRHIHVEVRRSCPAEIRTALHRWYRQRAAAKFSERLGLISQQAAWTGNRSIQLRLRSMKRTWGNCSAAGVIKLNTHLIKAPLSIIDSVIAHELCHLEEMNHGKAFYALLHGLNPNWRRDRSRLRLEGHLYLR